MMTNEQKNELEFNKLNLSNQGTDGIPAKLTHVDSLCTGDFEKDQAIVYAYTEEREGTVVCTSFLVRDCNSRLVYYYRDHLFEVLDLVSALKARNALRDKSS